MSYPINYPTLQGANVQIFYTGGRKDWVKPQGASFVWFTLIGGGGGGDNAVSGGGSSAVTNCMVPAFLIPDVLGVQVGGGGPVLVSGDPSYIIYQAKDGTGYTLLTALAGTAGSAGGAASPSNSFSAMGFYQSIAGQNGTSGDPGASTTTFLSAGAASTTATANYGYSTASTGSRNGFFQMQPIIVGVGGGPSITANKAGIGCGGGTIGAGGDGMVVIITW